MDFKLILTTFGILFLAELGDKTQLAVLALSAQHKAPFSVFVGGSLALIILTFLGAFVGDTLTKFIPIKYIHIAAGTAFILIGTSILWSLLRGTAD